MKKSERNIKIINIVKIIFLVCLVIFFIISVVRSLLMDIALDKEYNTPIDSMEVVLQVEDIHIEYIKVEGSDMKIRCSGDTLVFDLY
jgi:hypothetical protein